MNRNNRHLAECRHKNKKVDDEAIVVLFSCTGSKFDVSYMARRPSAWGHRVEYWDDSIRKGR